MAETFAQACARAQENANRAHCPYRVHSWAGQWYVERYPVNAERPPASPYGTTFTYIDPDDDEE